ncbi:hypothetical protein ABK040_011369 [Willaertia magna]
MQEHSSPNEESSFLLGHASKTNNYQTTSTIPEEEEYKQTKTPIYERFKFLRPFIKLRNFYESESLKRVRRWITLIVGAIVMIACGTQYSYSSISPSLKTKFDFTQTEVNTIGTAANLGTNFSFLFSIVNDFLGTRACSFVSGLCLFIAYFLMSLTVSGAMPWAENYIALSAFMFLMGNACGGGYTAAITASVKNFPERNRGLVVGVLASCFGISSAIYSGAYSLIFSSKLEPYLIFCAILGGIVVMIFGTIFMDSHSQAEQFQEGNKKEIESVEDGVINNEEKDERQLIMEEQLKKLEIPNVHSLRMLMSLDFYIIFLIQYILVGSGITIINNLGALVQAYGGKKGQQNPMVIVFAFSNCAGRLIFGILSDKLLNPKRNITRVTFIAVCAALMAITQFLFAVVPLSGFYPLVILLGLCYGGTFALTPSFNSERFGPKYFGLNSTIQSFAGSLGSYSFATGLAGYIYQINIVPPRTLTCHGRPCYEGTFYILCLINCFAMFLTMFLLYRTRWLYKRLYLRRQIMTSTTDSSPKLKN